MYHLLRKWHKWIGFGNALFLMLIAVTGFLLALKNTTSWIRPGEQEGAKIEHPSEVISVEKALEAAYSVGNPNLTKIKDVNRVDYRPKRNVFKILSKEGNMEVQVCGKTGNVLQVALRTDQITENIHDLSFIHPQARDYVLPFMGIGLFVLSGSGLYMSINPWWRRRKFMAQAKREGKPISKKAKSE
jgi:uncharacterized iron-regulated membrane protein